MFALVLFMARQPRQEDCAKNKFRKGDICISNALQESEITSGNLTCPDRKEPQCVELEGRSRPALGNIIGTLAIRR